MKRLVYYILWISGIIGIYLFSEYIEGNSLNFFYFMIGLISISMAIFIEKFTGALYKERIYFSLYKVFSKKSKEKIKLSNVIVLLSFPFILVAIAGWIVM